MAVMHRNNRRRGGTRGVCVKAYVNLCESSVALRGRESSGAEPRHNTNLLRAGRTILEFQIVSRTNDAMKIVSASEMRDIDRVTSERFGVPSNSLMENAGAVVARFALSEYPGAERVSIVCGKGNNGGDGFVITRKLVEAGRAVRVLLLCDP